MLGLGKKKLTYRCHCCNQMFSGSPSFGYKHPTYWFDVPEEDRDKRVFCNDDICHIRDENGDDAEDIYAIRCTLDVPIHGVKEPSCWGIWVTQSADSFSRYVKTFSEDQSGVTTFGWLPVVMPYYNRTASGEAMEHLACDVRWCGGGQRPKVILQQCDHPLYEDQQKGISWDKAVEIALSFHTNAIHK